MYCLRKSMSHSGKDTKPTMHNCYSLHRCDKHPACKNHKTQSRRWADRRSCVSVLGMYLGESERDISGAFRLKQCKHFTWLALPFLNSVFLNYFFILFNTWGYFPWHFFRGTCAHTTRTNGVKIVPAWYFPRIFSLVTLTYHSELKIKTWNAGAARWLAPVLHSKEAQKRGQENEWTWTARSCCREYQKHLTQTSPGAKHSGVILDFTQVLLPASYTFDFML